eukprot:TRINITY_DN17115_c0_g1_i1.p1 TRINITY_DN17115_c0_g1~~TRINITY_DN17115_c0_g1_i1.p1  ORF type:complete len:284 (+),score=61.61 TRINITY_DN17115_c0_g1_i1:44-895(+)
MRLDEAVRSSSARGLERCRRRFACMRSHTFGGRGPLLDFDCDELTLSLSDRRAMDIVDADASVASLSSSCPYSAWGEDICFMTPASKRRCLYHTGSSPRSAVTDDDCSPRAQCSGEEEFFCSGAEEEEEEATYRDSSPLDIVYLDCPDSCHDQHAGCSSSTLISKRWLAADHLLEFQPPWKAPRLDLEPVGVGAATPLDAPEEAVCTSNDKGEMLDDLLAMYPQAPASLLLAAADVETMDRAIQLIINDLTSEGSMKVSPMVEQQIRHWVRSQVSSPKRLRCC